MSRLTDAIADLENSAYQYSTVMQELEDLGYIEDSQAASLYVAIRGKTWQNYLATGGNPGMINDNLPRRLDFNYNHRAEVDA